MFASQYDTRRSFLRWTLIVLSVLFLLLAAAMPAAFAPRAVAQEGTSTPATSTSQTPDNEDTEEDGNSTGAPTSLTNSETPQVGTFHVDDASLRWGINKESSTKAYAPDTYNFMSAGDVSGAFTGPYMKIPQNNWKAEDGNVTIEKRTSTDSTSVATWGDTRTSQSGAPLGSNDDYSGLEAVFTGGEGVVNPEAGTATIEFTGSITIIYYSGYMYSTVTDPVLEITASGATVKATMGGHKSSMEDTTLWEELDPVEGVKIADLGRIDVSEAGIDSEHKGFSVNPKWDHVTYDSVEAPQVKSDASDVPWGSFPKVFVDFQAQAGGGPYWYTSGGGADKNKKPLPLTVSWDANDPYTPIDSGTGGSGYEAILRTLLDDVIDDTGNWAGDATREALKGTLGTSNGADTDPASPGEAAQATGQSGGTGGTGGEGGTTATSNGTYSGTSNWTGNYYSNYNFTETGSGGNAQPSTNGTQQYNAGTAGANAAPAGSSDPAASYDGIGASYVADNPDSPVTYALTSADSALSGFGRNWQWWIGGLMLAAALGTVLLTAFRRKV